jgi:hypothetical protein
LSRLNDRQRRRDSATAFKDRRSFWVYSMNMNESFDIFRREIDGSFVWVGATESFALARQKVVQDPAAPDREFLIVNALTGERMVVEPPERPPVESPL